jgi:hypothetical protein
MNQKLLMMTIYLKIFSLISQIIQFGVELFIFVFSSYISLNVYVWSKYIYMFIIVSKHFSTVFFYYRFNLSFKQKIKI